MQGDPGNSLLILLSGNARTSMIASNGHEIVLDYAEPGQVLGEIALLDGGERTASVTAIEPTSALTITREAFEEILKKHKNMALRLAEGHGNRIRMANTMIEGRPGLYIRSQASALSFTACQSSAQKKGD